MNSHYMGVENVERIPNEPHHTDNQLIIPRGHLEGHPAGTYVFDLTQVFGYLREPDGDITFFIKFSGNSFKRIWTRPKWYGLSKTQWIKVCTKLLQSVDRR